MLRFITFTEDDIICDPEGAAETLSASLSRRIPMKFSGICGLDGKIMIVLEEVVIQKNDEMGPVTPPSEYNFVFSPFRDLDSDRVAAEIAKRYEAGYSTLGSFRIGDALWGLFCYEAEKK